MVNLDELKAAAALSELDCDWWVGPHFVWKGLEYRVVTLPDHAQGHKMMNLLSHYKVSGCKKRTDGLDIRCAVLIPADYIELPPKREYTSDGSTKGDILAEMYALGIMRFTANFSGGGDSSNPDWYITPVSECGWFSLSNSPDIDKALSQMNAAQDSSSGDTRMDMLKEKISNWFWDDLCKVNIVDNDGGSGELEFDLTGEEPRVHLRVNVNEMTSTTEQDEDL